MYLYQFFDRTEGLYVSLSNLPLEEALDAMRAVQLEKLSVQQEPLSRQYGGPLCLRGKISGQSPKEVRHPKAEKNHYLAVECGPWLSTWF